MKCSPSEDTFPKDSEASEAFKLEHFGSQLIVGSNRM